MKLWKQTLFYANRPFPVTNIPTNLGVAIKADRILDFEIFFNENTTEKDFGKDNEDDE